MTRVVLKSATVVYRGGPRATDGEAVAPPWSVCVQKTDAHPLGGVPITFLQTSLDRKRRLVSWDDEGKGMRFREAEREAEWVGAEEQARQEQMPWPESCQRLRNFRLFPLFGESLKNWGRPATLLSSLLRRGQVNANNAAAAAAGWTRHYVHQ